MTINKYTVLFASSLQSINQINQVVEHVHLYKQKIVFSRSVTSADTVRLTLNSTNFDFSKIDSLGNTMYFRTQNDEIVYFYLEDFNKSSKTALLWLRSSVATSYSYIYMFYSPLAKVASYSSGSDVFLEFNNFDSFGNWNVGTLNNVTISDGLLKITNPTTGQSEILNLNGLYNQALNFDLNNSYLEIRAKNTGDLGSANDFLVIGIFETTSGQLNQYKFDFNPTGGQAWDIRVRSYISGAYERTITGLNSIYAQNTFYKFGLYKSSTNVIFQENYVDKLTLNNVTNITQTKNAGIQVYSSKTWYIDWFRLRSKTGEDVTCTMNSIVDTYSQTYVKFKEDVINFDIEFDIEFSKLPSNVRLLAIGRTNNFQNNDEVTLAILRVSATQIQFYDIEIGTVGSNITIEQGFTKYRFRIIRKNIGNDIRKDARVWIYSKNLSNNDTDWTLHATYNYSAAAINPKRVQFFGFGQYEAKTYLDVKNLIIKGIVIHEI